MPEIKTTAVDPVTCTAVGYQSASICVPVTVTPYAIPGTTVTKCCGDPVIAVGKKTCTGVKNGECTFTVTQDLCITVPVEFGAYTTIKDTYVDCTGASAEDTCEDCGEAALPLL